MSAIGGLYYFDDRPVTSAEIENISSALAVLGPDAGGVWVRGSAGLVHRLMCFTPEDRFENQPLKSADGLRVLVSDARIDNRPELTHDLRLPLTEAHQLPDSAFIMKAYERWGTDCPRHLIGDFAFAVCDLQQASIFAACSPPGGRTLFYHVTRDLIAFATMPAGLWALPFVPRMINEERLANSLIGISADQCTSYYHAILRLPGGYSFLARRDRFETSRYWQLCNVERIIFQRDDDYVEAFKAVFDRAVSDRLRSLTPIGIMMSGGLDSSSVAATSALLLKRRAESIHTFTEVPRTGFAGPVPKGRYADETPFVQAIARLHPNMNPVFVHTDGMTILDNLNRTLSVLEAPLHYTSNRVWMEEILKTAREQGIRVLMSGQAGNFTISWDGQTLLAELFRGGQLGKLLREAKAMTRSGGVRFTIHAMISQVMLPLLPEFLWGAFQRLRVSRGKFGRDTWSDYSPIHPDFAKIHHVAERARAQGPLFLARIQADGRQMRSLALDSLNISGFHANAFRAIFGVDLCDPTRDQRVIEYCLAIPEDQFLRDGHSRWLIRRAMADRLPPEVLWNSKKGKQAADWFERLTAIRGQLPEELSRLEQSCLASRVLDLARMRQLVERWPESGWIDARVINNYNYLLERGLMVGRYILWFENSQAKTQKAIAT